MKTNKTIEVKIERLIPTSPAEAFDGWLNPKIPGTTWNAAEELSLDPKLGGLFYWHLKGISHYGRFTAMERPHQMQHTWVSPNTLGIESKVTVTFQKQGENTLMTLVHTGLPDTPEARGHERGWNYFLDVYCEQFGSGSRKKFKFEEAHPESVVKKNEK